MNDTFIYTSLGKKPKHQFSKPLSSIYKNKCSSLNVDFGEHAHFKI